MKESNFKQIKNHSVIDPGEPAIINVVRYYDFDNSEHYYTIVVMFITDDEREEAYSILTDIREKTVLDAINRGLNGLQYIFHDINASAIIYDGDLQKPLSTINLNEVYGDKKGQKFTNEKFSEMVH